MLARNKPPFQSSDESWQPAGYRS